MRRYEVYKDTGLFWLPQIPQKWEWKFLSQVAKEQKDRKPENIDFAVMSLSYGNIIRKKILAPDWCQKTITITRSSVKEILY